MIKVCIILYGASKGCGCGTIAKDIERSRDVMSRTRGGASADRDPRGRRRFRDVQ